jgi:Ca2+-binding RTX toxin-like protein
MKKYYRSIGLISLILLMLPTIGYTEIIEISKDGLAISILEGEGIDSKSSNILANPTVSLPGTFATIKVDGDPGDWSNIPVLISDPKGDSSKADIIGIKVANNKDFVYLLTELATPFSSGEWISLHLDTDLNPMTGCQLGNWQGSEYGIGFNSSIGFIGPIHIWNGGCGYGNDEFPGVVVHVKAGNFIEASFPISVLEVVSPGLKAFNIWSSYMDVTTAARYNLASSNYCLGLICTINGKPSETIIQGTNGDDVICGTDKDDIILGKDGNDTICGGAGNDVILAGNGHDRVEGGPGNDVIDGGNGMDMLDGGPDNDVLLGGNDGDLLYGGMGFDYLSGGLGQDMLNGNPDDDICEKENSDKLLVSCENKVSSTNMSVLTLDKNFVSPDLAKNLNILMNSAKF